MQHLPYSAKYIYLPLLENEKMETFLTYIGTKIASEFLSPSDFDIYVEAFKNSYQEEEIFFKVKFTKDAFEDGTGWYHESEIMVQAFLPLECNEYRGDVQVNVTKELNGRIYRGYLIEIFDITINNFAVKMKEAEQIGLLLMQAFHADIEEVSDTTPNPILSQLFETMQQVVEKQQIENWKQRLSNN